VFDPEGESRDLWQRGIELVGLLDAGHLVLRPPPDELDESRRLGAAAGETRRKVAERVAAGHDPQCSVGAKPPIFNVSGPMLEAEISIPSRLNPTAEADVQ
jgi:hypothetical protein